MREGGAAVGRGAGRGREWATEMCMSGNLGGKRDDGRGGIRCKCVSMRPETPQHNRVSAPVLLRCILLHLTALHCALPYCSSAEHIRRGDADLMLAGAGDAAIIPSGIGGFIACKVRGARLWVCVCWGEEIVCV